MTTFCVITAVPPADNAGNLAIVLPLFLQVGNMPDQLQAAPPYIALAARAAVFHLGEIIVLDSKHGREIGGMGRKPSKWSVDTEEFEDIDMAIARSLDVCR